MATEVETLRKEYNSRKDQIKNLKLAKENRAAALAEAKQLDNNYKKDQESFKTDLESIYTEKRHYSGKEPLVYTQAQTDVFPYFQGPLNTDGNPYYRAEDVIAGTDKGLAPVESLPTRTGPVGYGRDQNYSPTENVNRTPVIQPLKDYPDWSGEPLPPSFPNAPGTVVGDQCFYGVGVDQPTCEADGGIWGLDGNPEPDPVWVGAETAPGIVRPLVTAWRADLVNILADVHEDDAATEAFWQSVIDECDDFLANLPADAVFVRNTGNSDPTTWGQTPVATGALATAITNLIQFAETDVPGFVSSRNSELGTQANNKEDDHFGIIKLRLHSVNGSHSKVKAVEQQSSTEEELIADHQEALDSIERLIISKS